MLRVLVALPPLMYRQAVAHSVRHVRGEDVDVRIAPPEAMEDQVTFFRPHLLVCNNARDEAPANLEEVLRAVPCCIEVIYTDGMDARLDADGRITEMRNASTDDLLAAVGEAAKLAEREEEPTT